MGVGTTRGAGVRVPGVWALERPSALGGVVRGTEEEEGRDAAADCAARASATGSVVSPSKNFAIATWEEEGGGV